MNDPRRSTAIALVHSIMRVKSFSERCFLSSAWKSSNGMGLHLVWLHFATKNTVLQTLLMHIPIAIVGSGRVLVLLICKMNEPKFAARQGRRYHDAAL